QHEFIRRLLGVNSRSVLAILHTETCVIPLPYRRAILALGYLIYLITLPERHFGKTTYLDSVHLANAGYPGWVSDLHFVLQSLPEPIHLPMGELDADSVIEIRKGVTAACERWLGDLMLKFASRLPLIQGRLERDEDGKLVQMPLKMRQYLRAPVPVHRKALTRLYPSSHTLAIEILRYTERYRERTPRAFRFCRFCHKENGSESHALLGCMTEATLVALRR
ncbi:hypothetical protein DFH09DRAFT_815923, partial [Mycena vulgaris]